MADPRNAKTEAAIKGALLRLMQKKPSAQVGVAELAREAGVSRSTFYNHFTGVYEVFASLVDDFNEGTSPIASSIRCKDGAIQPTPFCVRLRNAGSFSTLVADPGFLPELIERVSEKREALGGVAIDAGLSEEQVASLDTFQLAGCYAAAMALPREMDWEPSRQAIDHMLRARISSLGAMHAR